MSLPFVLIEFSSVDDDDVGGVGSDGTTDASASFNAESMRSTSSRE